MAKHRAAKWIRLATNVSPYWVWIQNTVISVFVSVILFVVFKINCTYNPNNRVTFSLIVYKIPKPNYSCCFQPMQTCNKWYKYTAESNGVLLEMRMIRYSERALTKIKKKLGISTVLTSKMTEKKEAKSKKWSTAMQRWVSMCLSDSPQWTSPPG